jgi:hypothetical protein
MPILEAAAAGLAVAVMGLVHGDSRLILLLRGWDGTATEVLRDLHGQRSSSVGVGIAPGGYSFRVQHHHAAAPLISTRLRSTLRSARYDKPHPRATPTSSLVTKVASHGRNEDMQPVAHTRS